MPRCPFAVWKPISGGSGPHLGGPFKIVHHTTEGHSAEDAMALFQLKRSDPHFTVDASHIYQHVDTSEGARALRNKAGGVQTNRDSAVQIELVGFAHLPKDTATLTNVARLCRWIERTHGVPREWPSGPPKPARNGHDPGGHNRDEKTWDTRGGHYGHCHVPENTHWDPAYSAQEATFVLNAEFGSDDSLVSAVPPSQPTRRTAGAGKMRAVSTMPDHDDVIRGVSAYIRDLALPPQALSRSVAARPMKRRVGNRMLAGLATVAADKQEAAINVGSLIGFVAGLDADEKDDVQYSVQLAQRAASGQFDRFTQIQAWYGVYMEVLENLGWTSQSLAFTSVENKSGSFMMDKAALQLLAVVASGNQLAILHAGVEALKEVANNDGTIELFDFHASEQSSGNFQLGAVQREKNGTLSMALGAYYFHAADQRKKFLFFKWGANKINFWAAVQKLTLNRSLYSTVRDEVKAKLADAPAYVVGLKLGKR